MKTYGVLFALLSDWSEMPKTSHISYGQLQVDTSSVWRRTMIVQTKIGD